MALTASDYANLAAAFGPSLITGIGQGGQASADRQLTAEEIQRQIEQQLYNRRQAGRAGLTAFYQGQLGRDLDAGEMLADRAPLGAEQNFAEQMARRRGLGQVASQYQPSGGMSPAASAFALQSPNMLAPYAGADYQQTVSRDATARSIAERRKALAGVDPNFQFGAMGDYGLPDLGGEVSQYAQGVQSRRQQSEQEMLRLLTEQMREASAAQIPGQTTATPGAGTASTAQPKKPSLLRRIAGAALPVAAAFIPGVGPVASALIQAGAGAAGSALAGGGVKGALTGAALGGLGAATGGLGSAAGRQAAKEGMGSFVQRAILNPRALTQIAGGAMGGDTGTALQAASLGMGRIPGRSLNTSFEQQGLPKGVLPGGGTLTTNPGNAPMENFERALGLPKGMVPGAGALTTDAGALPRVRAPRRAPSAPMPVEETNGTAPLSPEEVLRALGLGYRPKSAAELLAAFKSLPASGTQFKLPTSR